MPLLGYGIINSDATMKHVVLPYVIEGSTAGNGFSVVYDPRLYHEDKWDMTVS
jgi:hypothetical protein